MESFCCMTGPFSLQGPQLSGVLLSNDISEDDRRYWTNELCWGMGLWRGGGPRCDKPSFPGFPGRAAPSEKQTQLFSLNGLRF